MNKMRALDENTITSGKQEAYLHIFSAAVCKGVQTAEQSIWDFSKRVSYFIVLFYPHMFCTHSQFFKQHVWSTKTVVPKWHLLIRTKPKVQPRLMGISFDLQVHWIDGATWKVRSIKVVFILWRPRRQKKGKVWMQKVDDFKIHLGGHHVDLDFLKTSNNCWDVTGFRQLNLGCFQKIINISFLGSWSWFIVPV